MWTHLMNEIMSVKGLPGGASGKELPGDVRDMGSIQGQEGPLEEDMATHSSILG